MERNGLQLLSDEERKLAEENHNMIYAFLHTYNYSIDDFYGIAAVGYLKGIQAYNRKNRLKEKYDMFFVCWQYMRAEIGNYFRVLKAKKRMQENTTSYFEWENYGDDGLLDTIILKEIFRDLTPVQRKIVRKRLDGYSNKEIYLILNMSSSSYYKELQKIKSLMFNC